MLKELKKLSTMLNFDFQLNSADKNKSLTQIVEETFTVKKPVVDLSFFYNDKKDITVIETDDINKVKQV